MANRPADDKRTKISKAQQLTMLEVLGASLVLGTCLVLANFAIKYIQFNTKVITAKNEAITAYEQTIKNIGVCADTDNNGRISEKELAACNPNLVSLNEVVGSLRYNIYEVMAQNEDLETVARQRNMNCYDEDGKRYDFNAMYNQATDVAEREQLLQATKICSSLRVISDALPARKNTEALMASLNQIFIDSNWEPENLSPRDENVALDFTANVVAMPVSLQFRGDGATVMKILNNIDKSIRDFDITTATIEWTSGGLDINARANAYYLDEIWGLESETTVTAKSK